MAKQAPASPSAPPDNFENALGELERIVQTMEEGEMPLESSLTAYQRGVTLLKFCQDKLTAAEQTIQTLENGQLRATDLPSLAGDED